MFNRFLEVAYSSKPLPMLQSHLSWPCQTKLFGVRSTVHYYGHGSAAEKLQTILKPERKYATAHPRFRVEIPTPIRRPRYHNAIVRGGQGCDNRLWKLYHLVIWQFFFSLPKVIPFG